MEVGLREWLIVGAIIVIVLIVVDGWRRMRAQSNTLKIDIDDKLAELGNGEYNPELPLGSARVFKVKDEATQAVALQESVDANSNVDDDFNSNIANDLATTKSQAKSNVKPRHSAVAPPVNRQIQTTIDANDELSAARLANPSINGRIEPVFEESTLYPSDSDFDGDDRQARNTLTEDVIEPSEQIEKALHNSLVNELNELTVTPDETDIAANSVAQSQQVSADKHTTPINHSITVPDILKKPMQQPFEEIVDSSSYLNQPPIDKENDLPESHDGAISDHYIEQPLAEHVNDSSSYLDQSQTETGTDMPETQNRAFSDDYVERPLAENITDSNSDQAPSQLDNEGEMRDAQNGAFSDAHVEQQLAENVTDSSNNLDQSQTKTEAEISELDNTEADEEHVEKHSAEKITDSRRYLSQPQKDPEDEISEKQSSGFMEEDIERENAAKVNTDNIVNNLLSTLAQSKKTGNESGSGDPGHTTSHYQERIRKEENSVLIADKFEQLLAEKTAHSNLEITAPDSSQTEDLTEHQVITQTSGIVINDEQSTENDNVEIAELKIPEQDLPDSDQSEAVAAKQQEIDALKAKLEALSTQSIDSAQPLVEQASLYTESAQSDSTPSSTMQLTTVIDDEVNLADLTSDITKLPADLDAQSLEVFHSEVVDRDIELDPLMDGYRDNTTSQELVSQFEEGLAEDQQAVANELDMPITEILKKQLANSDHAEHGIDEEQAEYTKQDPLLADNQLPESLLSGAHFETIEESGNHPEESFDQDKLGFSAFAQDDISDPLMDDYVDEITELSITDETEKAQPELTQKSFFDDQEDESEPAFSQALEKAAEEEQTTVAELPEKVSQPAKKPRKVIANVDDPNAVLIVTVVAKENYLNGAALRRVVEACGMDFGDMDVFHRFEDGVDSGAVQFSMANAINPGTFDIELMDETATPGVSFFMSMDEPEDAKKALECMLATAETVALHLHGDLLDDDRSVLRPQTKEHYRERVRIHGMNKLRRRAQ